MAVLEAVHQIPELSVMGRAIGDLKRRIGPLSERAPLRNGKDEHPGRRRRKFPLKPRRRRRWRARGDGEKEGGFPEGDGRTLKILQYSEFVLLSIAWGKYII
jgi:hypothetical protein